MSKVVAVIVAHPDDEVLGCGGTIARMASEGCTVHVLIMADGESSRMDYCGKFDKGSISRRNESALQATKILGCMSTEQLALPDNRMDSISLLDVIKLIEIFIKKHSPEIVFTHHKGDVNIDHRIVHDAVVVACRPQPDCSVKELLFFEVPSSTEWRPPGSDASFCPNWFVDITKTIDLKLDALLAYKNELRTFPHPRSIEAIKALGVWRGSSVGVPIAEAFVLGRKQT